MLNKQNNWERVESVIKWANMSTNYFARYIGLPRGENMYQIKRGNNGISLDVAEKIVAKFPEVNKLWLLTGEGEMYVEDMYNSTQIPLYDADVEVDIVRLDELEHKKGLSIPFISNSDFAMVYKGVAMGDLVPAGTVVILKHIGVDSIIPGCEYVVVRKNVTVLRIIRNAEGADKLKLVAGDRDNFDDIVINAADILNVYFVQSKIIINR